VEIMGDDAGQSTQAIDAVLEGHAANVDDSMTTYKPPANCSRSTPRLSAFPCGSQRLFALLTTAKEYSVITTVPSTLLTASVGYLYYLPQALPPTAAQPTRSCPPSDFRLFFRHVLRESEKNQTCNFLRRGGWRIDLAHRQATYSRGPRKSNIEIVRLSPERYVPAGGDRRIIGDRFGRGPSDGRGVVIRARGEGEVITGSLTTRPMSTSGRLRSDSSGRRRALPPHHRPHTGHIANKVRRPAHRAVCHTQPMACPRRHSSWVRERPWRSLQSLDDNRCHHRQLDGNGDLFEYGLEPARGTAASEGPAPAKE